MIIDVNKAHQLWRSLHSYSASRFLAREKQVFLEIWIGEVERLLGCKTCFKKVQKFMKLWPPSFEKINFHLWGLCLHDYVNKELGKPFFYPDLTVKPLTDRGIIQ